MSIGESCNVVTLTIAKNRRHLEGHRDAAARVVPRSGQSKKLTLHGNSCATKLAGLYALNQRLIVAPR